MNTALNYPLVCFDLDGTLVDGTIYIWKTLHESFATNPVSRQKAYDDFFAGKISYEEWFHNDLVLLEEAGATKDRILEIVDQLYLMNGTRETLAELKARGHKLAVISGSLDIVLHRILGTNTFDYTLINKIHFDEAGRINGGVPTPFDLKHKATGLQSICDDLGISTDRAAFIGDNINDLDIARLAGRAIAFNCKSDELSTICDVEIAEKDLRNVLPHLE